MQVKTSEGIKRDNKDNDIRNFSFHPKIRYMMGKEVYDVVLFDDINLPTYQITDNQKTELPIDKYGHILKKGRNYDYSCFDKFHNNFDILESVN